MFSQICHPIRSLHLLYRYLKFQKVLQRPFLFRGLGNHEMFPYNTKFSMFFASTVSWRLLDHSIISRFWFVRADSCVLAFVQLVSAQNIFLWKLKNTRIKLQKKYNSLVAFLSWNGLMKFFNGITSIKIAWT